jgi:hypothetical protein
MRYTLAATPVCNRRSTMVTCEMRRSVFDSATVASVLQRVGCEAPSNPKRLMRCPLHEDDTPSFRVFERGYVCFGCGARGGIVDLILALGKASTRAEAARWLERTR